MLFKVRHTLAMTALALGVWPAAQAETLRLA